MMYLSQNPYTQEKLDEFELDSSTELSKKLQSLHDGFLNWSQKRFTHRAELFLRFSKNLEAQETVCANIISTEMGKPIHEARREIQKCCRVIEYFVSETPNLLRSISRPQVTVQPLGVVLGIMPWNFPFWQALRLIIPSVLMGNTCLIKHAPNVPQCTQVLIRLMHESGFDESMVNYAFLSNEQTMALIGDPRIVGVSLTGSERAGRAVAEVAGRELKPSVLELGGSDPFIVCEDANLDDAVDTALAARFGNAGQVCISAKRFIVHESLKTEFSERLVENVKKITLGNPLDENTLMGPLARKDLQQLLTQQVNDSVQSGDKVLFQETKIPTNGWFYPPTVLELSNLNSRVWTEETFGPVAVIRSFKEDAEALELANGSRYGLGAAVWTQSKDKAAYFKSSIQAGAVFVNQLVKSQPELPFGGVKCSGYGRELGIEGLLAFTNIKLTV